MQAVYVNPDEPKNLKKYTCNVCGGISSWTDQHGCIERPDGYFDVEFILCSDECRATSREPFIKWLASKEGWTKKTATENFDNYIKY